MHILAPKPANPTFQPFFNVDQSVGENGANVHSDDIILVQFFIKRLGERMRATTPQGQQRKARAMKVPLTGFCCAATIDGIRAWQESSRDAGNQTVVDGRVSTARGYNYGGGFWTIVNLNFQFRHHFSDIWPKLQNAPGCPGMLAAKTKTIL